MRVSVVIPCYNAETTVGDCLGSVLSQEGVDLEVICVDDGSTDATADVLANISGKDGRVHVISQENRGVSSARNAGLAAATGEVVLFVDVDDALVPGALRFIARQLELAGADCLTFGMRVEPEEATPLTLAHRLAPRDAVIDTDARRVIFQERSTHPYAVRVAFSRSFVEANGLRFDEALTLGEDEAFLMVAYRLAHCVALLSRQLYVYRMSDASASHRDNASEDVLPAKLQKHLALVASVMGEWSSRGLDRSCDQDLLDWCLDLLMLDVSRLGPEAQRNFYAGLLPVLADYFGPDRGLSVATPTARACLRQILGCEKEGTGGPAVSRVALVAFYLHSRGVSAVAERALASLRGRGAY